MKLDIYQGGHARRQLQILGIAFVTSLINSAIVGDFSPWGMGVRWAVHFIALAAIYYIFRWIGGGVRAVTRTDSKSLVCKFCGSGDVALLPGGKTKVYKCKGCNRLLFGKDLPVVQKP